MTQLLSERGGSSLGTHKDTEIKLKALNNATIKMAAQIEELECRNEKLTKKLKMVRIGSVKINLCLILYIHASTVHCLICQVLISIYRYVFVHVYIIYNYIFDIPVLTVLCMCVQLKGGQQGDGGTGHSEQGLRGSIADRYMDHNRSQLLAAIVDLELVRVCVCVCRS